MLIYQAASSAGRNLVNALAADAKPLGNLCEGEAGAPPFNDDLAPLGPGFNLLSVWVHGGFIRFAEPGVNCGLDKRKLGA